MRPNLELRKHLDEIEMREYIDAFKASSDRTRYVIFINTVITLLIVIASWNVWPASWSRRRITTAERPKTAAYAAEFERMHPRPAGLKPTPPKPAKPMPWEEARDAYVAEKLRLERATIYRENAVPEITLVPVPGLGMHVDVNDLGIVGGATLFVLTLLLCMTMIRQHENLYLAFFKVKRICERERLTHHDGESMANFLYHALAMGQVLNYPPTLARWGYGRRNQILGFARASVFFFPMFVHGAVFVTNLLTVDEARIAWGPATAIGRMTLQALLLIGIATFCTLTVIYSRSSAKRWRTMFELINPGLKIVRQRSWRDWVQFFGSKPPEKDRPILAEITYSLRPDATNEIVHDGFASVTLPLANSGIISQRKLLKMANELREDAERSARAAGRGLGEVLSYETAENRIDSGKWTVKLRCRYLATPAPSPPS